MAPYIVHPWLIISIAAVVPLRVSAEQPKTSAPQKRTGPWKFMNTGVIYLNLTTMNTSGILCKAAMRTELNATARTFSQDIGIRYRDAWDYKRVDYTQIRRNNTPVKRFTSVNNETNEYTMYTFPYVLDECAVIKKQTNTSRGPNNVCELWVNYKFFERKPEEVHLCTKKFQNHCKVSNATRYNIEDCHASVGKLILIA
ncbi:uncharacterized protein LOC119184562 [Rhipicephalus microplus]|uniref:uncharacterized protein LOC119184562 n=2 Tax=Rhipicephalus microplus TaxID=6941 RepID=UPI003F6C0755